MAIAALSLRPQEMLLEVTSSYTHTRMAFGAAVIANQAVHFRLAELKTELEALRALIYRAAGIYALFAEIELDYPRNIDIIYKDITCYVFQVHLNKKNSSYESCLPSHS